MGTVHTHQGKKVYQGDFSILNIYAPSKRSLTFIKETLLKFKSHNKPHTLMVGDVNIPLLPMYKLSRQILSKEIMNLTDIMNQMNLTDIYRAFFPNKK